MATEKQLRRELASCYRLFDWLGWTELIFNHITARADDEANIIFGTSLDESLGDEIQITVIATGFSMNSACAPCSTAAIAAST